MATSPNINTQVLSNIPKNFFPDHVYEDHPTIMKLIDKNDKQDGGLNWAPNRIATKDGTSTWFAGTSLAAVISSASQTSALLNETYTWKSVITPMTLTYDERLRANGDSEFTRIAMEDSKKEQCKLEHMDDLSEKLMTATGSSNQPIGLAVMLDPTATWGTVVPADDVDWVPNTVTASTVYSGPSVLNDAYVLCLHKGAKPKWMPTGPTLWAKSQNIFGMGIQTQNKEGGNYKFGIKSLDFMYGEIYLDRDMPSSDLWMLNPDTIKLNQSTKFWMKYKAPVEPTAGTDIHLSNVGYILSSFILGSTSRRDQGGYTTLA